MASIEKRGNSYRIKVSCGYKADGTQVFQRMTWTPDEKMTAKQIEKEVQRQAILFEEECKRGQIVSAVKFETFAEEWFEEYAKPNLRNTTYERMLQLRKRVYAAIGHLRMDKITPRQIQAFVNALSKDGANERTGKPLAPKTIRYNLSLISDVFYYAVKMGVVADNPCAKVTIPKGEQKEKQIYAQEELKISPFIMNILKQLKEEQDEEALRLSSKWVDTDRLFVKCNGLPMNPQTPYGWLKEFCEEHDFPFYGIHTFRHLHASLLIGAGIDPTTVSGILGHSQVSTSLNIYGHMFRENQVKACNAVAEALDFKKRGA